MKIKRIEVEVEGKHGTAVLTRDGDRPEYASLEITTPQGPQGFAVFAGEPGDRRRMAATLQEALDGFQGTAADVAPYAAVMELVAATPLRAKRDRATGAARRQPRR